MRNAVVKCLESNLAMPILRDFAFSSSFHIFFVKSGMGKIWVRGAAMQLY